MVVSKTSYNIKVTIKIPNPSQEHPPKPQIRTKGTLMFFAPSKSRFRAKTWIMGMSESIDIIKIMIKMPNPSQEPPTTSKVPNQDLKGMDILCTFKIKIEIQNSDYGCIKDQ